jgi:periplasmic protein TonB
MIVKCVITVEGKIQNCQIIKPLPHMEQAVLSWLAASKYTPVTFQGKPQQVSYVFNFKLSMAQ